VTVAVTGRPDPVLVLAYYLCGRKTPRTLTDAQQTAAARGLGHYRCTVDPTHWHVGRAPATGRNARPGPTLRRARRQWARRVAAAQVAA
jgi:hypothetical protein